MDTTEYRLEVQSRETSEWSHAAYPHPEDLDDILAWRDNTIELLRKAGFARLYRTARLIKIVTRESVVNQQVTL